jgi:transcription initiation factor TFIID TATA-box-binding protein
LEAIKRTFDGAEYIPEKFPGLVLRLDKPKVSLLIFESGRIVCTGALNLDEVRKTAKRLVKMLKSKGIKLTEPPKINVENIVTNGSFEGYIDLEYLHSILPNTTYQTEQFPGLKYAMDEPKVVFLLFANGKFVCAGAKNLELLNKGIEKMMKILEEKDALIPRKPEF